MKKIIFLLLISTGAFAQIVQPRSTTTFSNVRATGSMTVASKLRVGSTTAPSATLDVTGTMSVSGTSTLTGAVQTSTINAGNTTLYMGAYGNNNFNITGGTIAFIPSGGSTVGSTVPFKITSAAHFSLTASTNVPSFQITGATRGWLTGNFANQYESYLTAPTYTAVGASTITNAAGLYVEKPIAGTNMTISNSYGIMSNGSMYTDGNLIAGGVLFGSSTASNHTLGNLKILGTNASTVTSGTSSGTLAVLSDAVFPVNFNGDLSTVSDGVNYYWGNNTYMFGGATSNGTITIPYNCTLIGWDFSNVNGGTLATSETATLSIKGTTNYTCSSSITFSASSFQSTSGTISVNFTAGDRINASLLMPTFATNPSFIFCGLTLWFVRRQ